MAKKFMDNQVSVAILRNTRVAERKARFVVDQIRGKTVREAMAILKHINRPSAAPQVERLLKSAVSQVPKAKHPDANALIVGLAWADKGPMMKRWRPRAMGRAVHIKKRMCHVTLVLTAS